MWDMAIEPLVAQDLSMMPATVIAKTSLAALTISISTVLQLMSQDPSRSVPFSCFTHTQFSHTLGSM